MAKRNLKLSALSNTVAMDTIGNCNTSSNGKAIHLATTLGNQKAMYKHQTSSRVTGKAGKH
jgi:hypothetical protein